MPRAARGALLLCLGCVAGQAAMEFGLELRNQSVKAQDLRGERMLLRQFLRPVDPPLPAIMSHRDIISLPSAIRNIHSGPD